MENANDRAFVQQVVRNSTPTANERQIHTVIIFINADTDQNSKDSQLMRQYISNCTAKGYNVILAVTGVNKISPEQHNQQRSTIFQTFGVPKSRIVFVEAYFEETQKSFEKDKSALCLLEKALSIGNNFLQEKKIQTPPQKPSSFTTKNVIIAMLVCLLVSMPLFAKLRSRRVNINPSTAETSSATITSSPTATKEPCSVFDAD